MTTQPLWKEAAAFAARAHQGQIRKDGRTPYFAHPARVALTCSALFGCADETVLAAALLHDVIEDCGADYDEIAELFGREVAQIVAALTKDMRLPEDQREKAYDAQMAAGPWQARLIKLADVHDNIADAWNDASRLEAIEKGHRALRLAQNDPQAPRACEAVRALIEQMEQ